MQILWSERNSCPSEFNPNARSWRGEGGGWRVVAVGGIYQSASRGASGVNATEIQRQIANAPLQCRIRILCLEAISLLPMRPWRCLNTIDRHAAAAGSLLAIWGNGGPRHRRRHWGCGGDVLQYRAPVPEVGGVARPVVGISAHAVPTVNLESRRKGYAGDADPQI